MQRIWFCVIVCFVFLSGCQKEDVEIVRDFAGEIDPICFPDGQIPVGEMAFLPTAVCHDAIQKRLQFDGDVDQYTAEYGDQRDRVVKALYFLRTQPLAYPMDKKVGGVVPAEEFLPAGMRRMKDAYPDRDWRWILFNTVLNVTNRFEFKQIKYASAYFSPAPVSIVFRVRSRGSAWENVLADALILVHEQRHWSTGQHEIFCKKEQTVVPNCDLGLDKPFNWEVSYLWMLLQGAAQMDGDLDQSVLLSRASIAEEGLRRTMTMIYGLPSSWRALQDNVAVSAFWLAENEGMPWLDPFVVRRDYYTDVVLACSDPDSSVCDSAIRRVAGIEHLKPNCDAACVIQIGRSLRVLMKYRMEKPSPGYTIGGIAGADVLFSKDVDVLWSLYPGQKRNQVVFNVYVEWVRNHFDQVSVLAVVAGRFWGSIGTFRNDAYLLYALGEQLFFYRTGLGFSSFSSETRFGSSVLWSLFTTTQRIEKDYVVGRWLLCEFFLGRKEDIPNQFRSLSCSDKKVVDGFLGN